ncbi:MAG TPA: nucleotidyl transferase AbiEii/AbiGii toxin family protein, partial [Archangium sp.]
RESVDVDFLCGSTAGYRLLREAVFSRDFAALVSAPVKTLRPLRTDQYGLRTFVEIDGVPIKFEIVREARIELAGAPSAQFGVPLLSREDLFAEKLLANVDRVNDRGTFNRDAIDLGMMREAWGPVPAASLQKAEAAYGPVVRTAVEEAGRRLSEPEWLAQCLTALSMSQENGARAMAALRSWLALP